MDQILDANRRHAEKHGLEHLPVRPGRRLAVVACMDSRLDVFDALGLSLGDAHVIRNAGGLVTDDVIRSLLISQRMLGTQGIVLVHHTECGLLNLDEPAVRKQIAEETGAEPGPLGAFKDVTESVRESIRRLQDSPFVSSTEIRGFVYDVQTGLLREVLPAGQSETGIRASDGE